MWHIFLFSLFFSSFNRKYLKLIKMDICFWIQTLHMYMYTCTHVQYLLETSDHSLLTLNLPWVEFKSESNFLILRKFEVVFLCLEWECYMYLNSKDWWKFIQIHPNYIYSFNVLNMHDMVKLFHCRPTLWADLAFYWTCHNCILYSNVIIIRL